MEWCLVEIPAEYKDIRVVIDTTATNDYYVTTISRYEIAERGGYLEWQEILCPDELTEEFMKKISQRLVDQNFLPLDRQNDEQAFREALREYQRVNFLPVGQFDLQTLESLGVM